METFLHSLISHNLQNRKYVIIQKEYREGDTKESVIEYYKNMNISSKDSSGY